MNTRARVSAIFLSFVATFTIVTAGAQTPQPMLPPPADVAAPPADAFITASGLATRVLKADEKH